MADGQSSSQKHALMMKAGQGHAVRVSVTGLETVTAGQIRVQSWNKKERMARALKFGGFCWGAALISIILPVLHFFLVPSFLIAGPIVVFFTLGQENVVLGGEGTCPRCGAVLPLSRGAFEFPMSDLCTECQCRVKVEPADGEKG